MRGRCKEESWCWVKGRGVLPWVLSLLWIQKAASCVRWQFGGHLGCSHHLEAT